MSRGPNLRIAAHTILPELPELLGAAAPSVARELGELLAVAELVTDPEASAAAEERLHDLLTSHDATRRRLDELMGGGAERSADASPYLELAGDPSDIPADRYACPACDYVFVVLDVDDTPPVECPVHRVPLVFRVAG